MPVRPDFPVILTSRGITQITPNHNTLCSKCDQAREPLPGPHAGLTPSLEPVTSGLTQSQPDCYGEERTTSVWRGKPSLAEPQSTRELLRSAGCFWTANGHRSKPTAVRSPRSSGPPNDSLHYQKPPDQPRCNDRWNRRSHLLSFEASPTRTSR